jgi:CdiI immunity protein
MTDYPLLRHFFGAYMHEDWFDEFPNEWAVADQFVQDEPFSVTTFAAEIDQLLADCPKEKQLRHKLLDDFGAAAMVENRGWKYRDWLQAMADHVQKASGHPRAS